MEMRDRQPSLSAMSNTLSVAHSRRISVCSSTTSKSRKTSRIEFVKMHGGNMFLEVNETDDAISLASVRRDSLSGASTIAGISSKPDTNYFDKIIKNEMAHHSPEIGGDDPKDKEENDEATEDAVGPDSPENEEPILKYGILNVLNHLYLATASPAIFRTPALAYKWSGYDDSGSGFFLIYVLVTLMIAMPLCVMEEIIAQFSSLGTITVFRCLPLLRGIGFGMVTACFIMMLYSGTIFTWSLMYIFDCFGTKIPWKHCIVNSSVCMEVDNVNHSQIWPEDAMIPSEFYFLDKVLGAFHTSEGNWLGLELGICLAFLWFGILCLMTLENHWGASAPSKAISLVLVAFLASIMFIGLPLSNSGTGLSMVLHIDFQAFAQPSIWMDALGQAAWTLGSTMGLVIARASYKNFRDRIRLDVYSATATNILVSLWVLLALSPYHGHLDRQGDIDKTPGYFFVMSSYAVAKLSVPQLGGIVLYVCVCKAAIDNTYMMASTVAVSISDVLPPHWRTRGRKIFCFGTVCAFGLVFGSFFIMTEGLYLLRAVDTYVPWVSALVLGLLEASGLAYIYGATHIRNHFKIMMRKSLTVFELFWRFIVPPALLVLTIWICVTGIHWPHNWHNWNHLYINPSRESMYDAVGIALAVAPIVVAFLVTAIMVFRKRQNLRSIVTPEETWGPALYQHRALYQCNAGIRRAKSKAPYLVVAVENEQMDSRPRKRWIPYGFYLTPSKLLSLRTTQEFALTDIDTQVTVACRLVDIIGRPRSPDEEANGQADGLNEIDLLQKMLEAKNFLGIPSEDQKSLEERRSNYSNLSTGILLSPKSISECSNTSVEVHEVPSIHAHDNPAFQN